MSDVLAIFLFVIILANTQFIRDEDNTDDPGGSRSHLMVYTDYRTGCQYLGTVLGGITSRLDSDGKPVCERKGQSHDR